MASWVEVLGAVDATTGEAGVLEAIVDSLVGVFDGADEEDAGVPLGDKTPADVVVVIEGAGVD